MTKTLQEKTFEARGVQYDDYRETERNQSMEDLTTIRAASSLSPLHSHSRTRSWCRAELTYIYHRNPESPSNVTLAAAGTASVVDPIIPELPNN